MPPNERNKLNRIEELKGKLFSKNYQVKLEHRDNFAHHEDNVPDSWASASKIAHAGEKLLQKTSLFKNFFIFSLCFFILALGYAGYVLFSGGNTVSNSHIDISVLGNNFTAGGDELPLVIGITNRNNSALDLVDLVIEYPKNVSSTGIDPSAGTEHLRESLGTIPAGAVHNENMKVTLFGEQGSVIPLKISIEYRVEGSNAIFVKEKTHQVTINSSLLNLSVDAPNTISPNQNVTLNVKATLNATKLAPKMLLKAEYPVGFQFVSSLPAPTLGNNIWDLGDLAPGAEHNIAITGKMLDVFDGEQKTFRFSSGSQSVSDKSVIDVVFSSFAHTFTIKKPFIETKLFVNGVYQREYAVNTNGQISAEIHWSNNLDTKINDLEIRAKILGNVFDRKTVNAQEGFYNSLDDTIIWDKNSEIKFKEIDPGDSGSVSFSMSPKSLYSALGGLLPDPSINVEVSITGKQSLQGYATQELKNFDATTIKVISDIGFSAKTLYFSGPFKNTGSIPPVVEKETTYTIVWSVSNSANNISKAVIHSSIPSWIRFVGTVSPSDEDLTFNASTKEITWNIGRIPKGTSITEPPKTVAFQIAFIPSLSQVGTTPVIINDAILTGHDDFANVDVKVNKTSLRTGLDNDISFPSGGDKVVQ